MNLLEFPVRIIGTSLLLFLLFDFLVGFTVMFGDLVLKQDQYILDTADLLIEIAKQGQEGEQIAQVNKEDKPTHHIDYLLNLLYRKGELAIHLM